MIKDLFLKIITIPLLVIFFISCSKKDNSIGPRSVNVNQTNSPKPLPGLSLAVLRNTKVIKDSLYISLENGINGTWMLDSTDLVSKDNTGTIIVTTEGKRLKRLLSASDPIYAVWFGLKGDGSDETDIIQNSINASIGRILNMPSGVFFAKKIKLSFKYFYCWQ